MQYVIFLGNIFISYTIETHLLFASWKAISSSCYFRINVINLWTDNYYSSLSKNSVL